MKDPQRSDVLGSQLEAAEAPVVTSMVSTGSVARVADSVESIVEEAFDANAGRLKAFARAAVRDDAAAEDLVQETFLRFVRAIQRGPVPDNVGGWLFRVCANLIKSRGRRRSVAERMKALLIDRSTAPAADEGIVRADERDRLHAVLAELPRDARVALLMAAEGFSAAEIGESIGRTAGATATYICRTRVRMRELLAGNEEVRR